MRTSSHVIGVCAGVMILALIVVGAATGEVVRHLLQTLPVWPAAILGLRDASWAKWAGLPVFFYWLGIMALIWLSIGGLTDLAAGSYSPLEIAMTAVVGAASVVGIVACHLKGSRGRPVVLLFCLILFAAQVGVMALSLRPPLDSDAAFLHSIGG